MLKLMDERNVLHRNVKEESTFGGNVRDHSTGSKFKIIGSGGFLGSET